MHVIESLYQEHLARRQLPPRALIERHTRRITDERLARTIAGRLVVVSHVERGETIRLISARLAGRREKKAYEEGQDGRA